MMKTWMLYDGGMVEGVNTVEAENKADALKAMCEMLNNDNEVYNYVVVDEEIYQYEGEIQDGDESVRVYDVEPTTYTVEAFDGFVIGEYNTVEEAIEGAKAEWDAQHEEHKSEGDLDPMIADEEWIYIKNKDNDDADYGYITRSGELKKY